MSIYGKNMSEVDIDEFEKINAGSEPPKYRDPEDAMEMLQVLNEFIEGRKKRHVYVESEPGSNLLVKFDKTVANG